MRKREVESYLLCYDPLLHKLRSKYTRKHQIQFNAQSWCQYIVFI